MIDDIPILNEMSDDLRNIVARLLLLAVALILIWVMRRVLTRILIVPLRGLSHRNDHAIDDAAIDMLIVPLRLIVIAVGILVSVKIFAVGDTIDVFIENVARTLIIVSVLMLIYRFVDLFAANSPRLTSVTGLQIEEQLLPFLRTAIRLIAIAIGLVIILQEWGYDVSGLVAGLGLGGLAFSLAAQDTVANLFGFVAIVSDNPFDVGEFIKTPDVEGIVEHVGLRSTRVRQLDQAVVYVPNNKLANSAILNWSRLSKRRINYVLGVTYDSTSGDIRVLLHRVREMLKAQETIDPESVVVYFTDFGGSSLDILIRAYVLLTDWGEFTAEKERLNMEVMDIVSDLGMSIAFPSTSLYIENIQDIVGIEHTEKPKPTLSPRERALKRGDIHEKQEPPPPSLDGENITGQQDEPDD
jgi:MscS family membrane protein